MLKILAEQWGKYNKELKERLTQIEQTRDVDSYKELLKETFDVIFNNHLPAGFNKLNLQNITEIDNGDYQGTLLFLVPIGNWCPSEYDYLMTYIGYGSCSGCDSLQAALYGSEDKVFSLLEICKDILQNTIKPYNSGWRNDIGWENI